MFGRKRASRDAASADEQRPLHSAPAQAQAQAQRNGVRRRVGVVEPGPRAALAGGAPTPSGPSPPHEPVSPVSVGADEMTWADAGSGTLVDDAPPPTPLPSTPTPTPPSQPPRRPHTLLLGAPRGTQQQQRADEDEEEEEEEQEAAAPRPRVASFTVPRIHVHPPSPATPPATPHPREAPRPLPLLRLGAASSLPANMDSPDLQLTPDSSQNGGDLSDSSFTDVEGEGDEEDDDDQNDEASGFSDGESGIVKVPLRNARRKSVMPKSAPVIKVNDIEYLDVPDHSPGNSITSINSIASLLKEKLALTLPAVVKNPPKRSKEYKLHAFVGLLFLCIVFLVGFAYVFYHQQVLQRAYFPKIRFNNKDRVVRIYNEKDNEVLVGFLGQDLGHDTAFACLPRDQIQEAACMEWMHKARLYMSYKEYEGRKCYRIIWNSLSEDVAPTDCYDWTSEYGHWYGGGQTPNMQWPVERGEIKMAPFITGDTSKHQWGNVVKRYFINSNGVVLFVDPNTPLYVSINETYSKKFCLQAKHDNFSYVYHRPLPTLNYTICTSENLTSLHQSHISDRPVSTLSLKDREMIDKLMTEPIWHIIPSNSSELTEKNIFNYSEDVLKYKFLKHGHILINEFWQENIGDFVLDNSRFPKMNDTIDILHRRGFRIIFSIQPFISTEAITFKEAVRNELLVSQRGPDHYIPSLTRYKSVLSAGVIDITKKVTIPWLQNKLKPLMDNYAVDSFYVDIGSAYDLPFYYEFEDPLANPDEYKTVFMDSMSSKIDIVGVSSAITRPNGPVFVSLPPYPSTWESLQSVIASVLTYGIIGFPLVMPGPIGGNNVTKMFKTTDNETEKMDETLPEKELYMRWLQLSAFLPAMSFSYLPQKYGDEKVINLAESVSNLRETLVNPIVKEYLKAYGPLDEGLPFNRPLWMLDPKDPICHTIVDEFSVGEELIVAPVITKDAREREIYLPAGVWRDGIDGSLMKGSRWLHHHPVEEDKIAYFVRMPDDTRF